MTMIELRTRNDGLVQDGNISIADSIEILQSCTKPSTYMRHSASMSYTFLYI